MELRCEEVVVGEETGDSTLVGESRTTEHGEEKLKREEWGVGGGGGDDGRP